MKNPKFERKMNKEKEFIIKNTPDYYIAREKIDGEIISKPIRKKIREIVYQVREYVKDDKTQQYSVIKMHDANDIVFEFFQNEPDEVFIDIINMYTDEYTAVANDETNKLIHETEEIIDQKLEQEIQNEQVMTVLSVGLIIFVIIVFIVLFK